MDNDEVSNNQIIRIPDYDDISPSPSPTCQIIYVDYDISRKWLPLDDLFGVLNKKKCRSQLEYLLPMNYINYVLNARI